MDSRNLQLTKEIIGKTLGQSGEDSLNSLVKELRILLSQKKLPKEPWSDLMIQSVLADLAMMDSNNFTSRAGVGEREGRVFSPIVQQRHFFFSHGIGRSGEISAIQPKAAGSSLMAILTNTFAKHALKLSGIRKVDCIVVPMATGMSISLVMLALKSQRPQAKYVVWTRIDQKTCLKCIYTIGLQAIVVEPELKGDAVITGDVLGSIEKVPSDEILCVLSTTSCFAPREPDDVERISIICKEKGIPHVINNAYGLQCHRICEKISSSIKNGRVDAVIQSTDKNFMVPVGGAVIASPNSEFLKNISSTYPGRASGAPILDLFVTFLSMGEEGYQRILRERRALVPIFKQRLSDFAISFGEKLLNSPNNTISFAISLEHISNPTAVGSALFLRRVSGTRVIIPSSSKLVCGISFNSYGASYSNYPVAYITAACAVGLSAHEVDVFFERLSQVLGESRNS